MFQLPDLMSISAATAAVIYTTSVALAVIPFFHAIKKRTVWLHSISVNTTDWRSWSRGDWLGLLIWIHLLTLIPIVNTAAVVASLVSYWPNHFPKFKQWIDGSPFKHKQRNE